MQSQKKSLINISILISSAHIIDFSTEKGPSIFALMQQWGDFEFTELSVCVAGRKPGKKYTHNSDC